MGFLCDIERSECTKNTAVWLSSGGAFFCAGTMLEQLVRNQRLGFLLAGGLGAGGGAVGLFGGLFC